MTKVIQLHCNIHNLGYARGLQCMDQQKTGVAKREAGRKGSFKSRRGRVEWGVIIESKMRSRKRNRKRTRRSRKRRLQGEEVAVGGGGGEEKAAGGKCNNLGLRMCNGIFQVSLLLRGGVHV